MFNGSSNTTTPQARLGLLTELVRNVRLAWRLGADPRVALTTKLLVLGLTALYILSPVDLFPDVIPVLGQLDDLVVLVGSSLYAARFGPVRVISTCVEPNPACPSRECSLYASHSGVDWKRFAVHERDGYHPFFFQFGTIVLPYACNSEPRGIFSGQAISGLDDKVSFVDFSLREASPRAGDEERKPP